MGKCLGPCVGAVDRAGYHAAAERAAAVLGGRDGALLDELVARRDALAEDLRFEDAARLRDRIRELEHVVGVQRRLEAVAERNLAIVAPSARPGAGELFLIHGGRLAHQLTVVGAVRRAALARALERTFAARPAPVTRASVDEMHLLDGWLRRHTERLAIVQVNPAEPRGALDAIVAALRTARSAPSKLRRPARRPTVRKPASSSTAAPARAS